jgi:hypothetical protein
VSVDPTALQSGRGQPRLLIRGCPLLAHCGFFGGIAPRPLLGLKQTPRNGSTDAFYEYTA